MSCSNQSGQQHSNGGSRAQRGIKPGTQFNSHQTEFVLVFWNDGIPINPLDFTIKASGSGGGVRVSLLTDEKIFLDIPGTAFIPV